MLKNYEHMNKFSPIAIIGQGCVYPDANNPEEFFNNLLDKKVSIYEATEAEWGADFSELLAYNEAYELKNALHTIRGSIRDFRPDYDSDDFKEYKSLGGVFKWSLHVVHQALRSAGLTKDDNLTNCGLIMGNLMYPMREYSDFIMENMLNDIIKTNDTEPLNRLSGGLPFFKIAEIFGMKGKVFSLDAACASSLYALKYACDELHTKRSDMMIAGGVSAADELFLNIGFTTLGALSPSGSSLPFSKKADGLIPSQGAGALVLKRLDDAIANGDQILGVIRGIGLANDGKTGGFLSPSTQGQVNAMKAAIDSANINPNEVSFIECHATGTPKGDPIEIQSIETVYGHRALHLGSIKANLGHVLAASGMAGMIKIIKSFEQKKIPGTPSVTKESSVLDTSHFLCHQEPVSWDDEKKMVAISNFGFGGNNAHVIIQSWSGKRKDYPEVKTSKTPSKEDRVAVVGVDLQTSQHASIEALFFETSQKNALDRICLDQDKLGFPPLDLKRTLGQQLLAYTSIRKVLENKSIDHNQSGVFVGIGIQEGASYESIKYRLSKYMKNNGIIPSKDWLEKTIESLQSIRIPGLVFGNMPNLTANRLNNFFDIKGVGFTVGAEELSGNMALDIAMEAIIQGDLNTAIVCACEIDEATLRKATGNSQQNGVVTLLLKSEEQALKDGDEIITWLNPNAVAPEAVLPIVKPEPEAHAANGLMNIALHIFAQSATNIWDGRDFKYAPKQVQDSLATSMSYGKEHKVTVSPVEIPLDPSSPEKIYTFSGRTLSEMLDALEQRRVNTSGEGCFRLAILAAQEAINFIIDEMIKLPLEQWIQGWITEKAYFTNSKAEGEVAFVYTGAASSYKGVGKSILKAFPSLLATLESKNGNRIDEKVNWIYNDEEKNCPAQKLKVGSLISQLHTTIATQLLNLKPDAALGLSAGETYSLIALGVINDPGAMVDDLIACEFYEKHLYKTYDAVKKGWQTEEDIHWGQYLIEGDLSAFIKRTEDIERVYVTMIHTDTNFVLSGDAKTCESLITELKPEYYTSIGFDFAIHTPVINSIEAPWRKAHTRKIKVRSDIRFYSEYFNGPYTLSAKKVADALTFMGLNRLDFRKVIHKAYEDGVRVFVEQGPMDIMTRFVSTILKDKPHMVIPFDTFGVDSLLQLQKSISQLWALQLGDIPVSMQCEIQPKIPQLEFNICPPKIVVPPIPKAQIPISVNNENNHYMKPPRVADLVNFSFDDFNINEALVLDNENIQHYSPLELQLQQEEKTIPEIKNNTLDYHIETHPLVWHYNKIIENRAVFLQSMHQSHQNYMNSLKNLLSSDIPQTNELMTAELDVETKITSVDKRIEVLEIDERKYPETIFNENLITSNDSFSGILDNKQEVLPGPKIDKTQLLELASGKISKVFGPLFEQQDHYSIQVRMPEPPMLLCDRITGIKGEAGSMSTGVIWTETDVKQDSWYLYNNRMPAGIFIEAGQADLLLVSWMGVDFHQNKGERAYRLLGCELTFHGPMPEPGDTLKYEIHLDGYANMGDVSLFFFHYDCYIDGKLRSSVRNGQAGFFTKKELAESSGVIWSPEEAQYTSEFKMPDLSKATMKVSFSKEDIKAYQSGDLVSCFGDSFCITQSHSRTPKAASDTMNLLDTIPIIDFKGGPAGRGYLKSEYMVSPDDWFFKGHFKNDECMPGTLMADACLQMMAFYLVAAGYSQNKDGWRFQPVPDKKSQFICRGQVTPTSKKISYEVFVDEIIVDGTVTMFAHVLATVDDRLKIFMCERLSIQLVPDFPITTMKELLIPEVKSIGEIAELDSFKYDYASLIHCALGDARDAFGPIYEGFDPTIPCPRLPRPPYHFMSRISYLGGKPGDYNGFQKIRAVYDTPPNAWYFKDNKSGVMPFAILMETVLQPCGWLSTYAMVDEIKNKHLLFRNLDGTAIQHINVTPLHKTIETTVELKGTAILGEQIIVNFDVSAELDGKPFFEMKTVFGFFDLDSMENQKGETILPEEQQRIDLPSNILRSFTQDKPVGEFLRLSAKDKLLMIDRMVYFDPIGGKHAKGYIRGEKDVDVTDWYFNAHFYSDPVQPGSLGVEALIQLIQAYLLHSNPEIALEEVSFEPIILGRETEWHYRGQVVPKNKLVILDFEVAHLESSEKEIWVEGEGRLWVNDLKIYTCPKIGVKMKLL